MSKYSIKSRFFSVSFKQSLYKEYQVFLTQSTFLLHKSKSISFCSSNFQCKINPKTVITFNNCMKSSGNLNLVPKHIMTSM